MNLNFLSNINLSSILGGFNKTLNVVKKSIPVYKEIRPYLNKEKSLFKNNEDTILNKPNNHTKSSEYNENLTFFQ